MIHNRLSGFTLLLLFFSSFSVIGSAQATRPESNPRLSVKIAVLANFPPQYTLDDNGKPTGFAVDVMNQVAGLAHLDPAYVVFQNWPDAQQALRSGSVDIIPNMGITKRRQAFAGFTAPVETFPVSIFVRKAQSDIQTVQDLPGHKVVVVEVNVGYTLLKDRRDIQLVIAHNPSEAIMFLLSGQADAMVYPHPVILQLAHTVGIENKLKVVGKPLMEVVRGIAVQKGRKDLLGRLDAAVQRFVTTEAYQRLYVRWYGEPGADWTKRRIIAAMGLALAIFSVGMLVMRYITLSRFSKTLEKRVQERTEALTASEENFRFLFENASFGIAVHELVFDEHQNPANYVLTNVNPSFYEILGFTPGSATGRLATEFYGTSEAPFLEQYAAVALGAPPLEMEVEFDPLGKTFKTSVYSHRHQNFVTVFEDITDRKGIEKALRQSEAKFRELFQVAAIPLCHVRRDGVILAPNSKFIETFGYDEADIPTLNQWREKAYPNPEYRQWVIDTWEVALQQAMKNQTSVRAQEYQVTCKNGDVRNVLIGGSTFEEYFLAYFVDITERKHAERNLRYYEKIASTVDTLLSLVDRDGIFLQVNDALAGILGRKREEIIGRSMAQIADSENYARMKPQIKQCLAGETVSQEMWLDWPDGTKRFFHIISYPMFDEDGTVYAVAGVGHDMTETYQANEALTKVNKELMQANEALQSAKQTAESANKAKSIFLSNMSHELRTPLNAILGYTQILGADETFGAKQQSGIQTIHQAGEHLLMIINDVLDMSKIEAGMLQLVPTKIQLLPFFENIIDFFKYRAREKGLSVTFETDQALSFVIVADELRLRQVIFNLLSNAIKFTTKGYCRLRVEAKRGKENRCRLKIAVEDSGVGIPKEQQDEVFDPFKQVGEHLQYKEGSGLGLAISRQLVHLMGGELVLSSPVNASPTGGGGVGSRFSFSIEAQVVDTEITTTPPNGKKITGYEHTGKTNQPVKILIVDDKMSNRAVLRDTLRPLGFSTQEAEDGSMVTQICLKTHPDLILMDLRMPNVDGFSAMNQLKHHDDLQNIPVVAVTASTAESAMLEKRCIQHGFKGFILKPFVTSDLLESIAECLPIALIYQEAEEQEPAKFSKIEFPPLKMVEKLSESLSKGDIEGILEQAEAIGVMGNGKYQGYSQIVQTLANDFKFSELEKLISSKENADDEK